MKTLIIDSDPAFSDLLGFTLRRSGFDVASEHEGLVAITSWEQHNPDLIILDLTLTDTDGMNVCQRIRAVSDIPIIILSVRADEEDIVQSLEAGADDYIIKPFSPRQLIARAEALLRRANRQTNTPSPIAVGQLHFDQTRCEVFFDGAQIASLTRLECSLLKTLMINHGQVLPYDTLIYNVWGPGGGDRAMLKQLVYRLRRKLEKKIEIEGTIIETVPNVGYALVF